MWIIGVVFWEVERGEFVYFYGGRGRSERGLNVVIDIFEIDVDGVIGLKEGC